MKKKLFIFLFCLLNFSFCWAKEPTFEQKQALFMMNYAQYSAYKLKTYNNIAALEDEYKNLKDNMNLEIIKDDSSVQTINYLMDAIHEERKNNKNRERLEASIERKMNNAIYDSIPQVTNIFVGGGNPLSMVISAAQTSGMMYLNYKKYKNQLSEEYDDQMWEYQQLSEDELNFIYKELNTYSHQLIQQYGISDEWRVNENELSKLFNFLKDDNISRKYTNLKNLTSDRYYQHFPLFWYHLAQAALDSGNDKDAITYYDRFESENIQIFRYDTTAVDAYKGKISILLKNPKVNNTEIISKLKFIERNKTTWNDYYFCSLVYANIGDINNAKRLLERNISELSSLVDNDLLDKSSILKIYTSDYDLDNGSKIQKDDSTYKYYQSDFAKQPSKKPYNINYDGLELSRNLLQKIGNEDIALNSITAQYKQDTTSLNEALYFFGTTNANKVVQNSLTDVQKIKVSTTALSEKALTITCQLPLQWMLSSSTRLFAVLQDSSKRITKVELYIDNSAIKKLKKEKISECELIYSTGKITYDWKKNGTSFVGLVLEHPLYPIELKYNLDLDKYNKNQNADYLNFNGKDYKIEKSKNESSSIIDIIKSKF